MKSIWTATCTAVFALTTTALFAQTPPQPPQTQPPAPPSPQSTAQQIVVTGCLVAAAPANPAGAAGVTSATGTTGTTTDPTTPAGTTGAAPEQKFILKDATTTPGTPKVTYRLVANAAALAPHLGKKLELTGTLDDSAAPAQDSSSGPDAQGPKLRVASGKVVAANCTEPE